MKDIFDLSEVVSPALLRRAADLSERLRSLGIPHALVGGLAVGLHGHPRSTKDVDFLVGEEAFASSAPLVVYRDELKALVRVGEVDLMAVPQRYPNLREDLRLEEDLPVISLRSLILMKLDAFRARDQEDVRALLSQSPEQVSAVYDYLRRHAPLLISRLGEVLASII